MSHYQHHHHPRRLPPPPRGGLPPTNTGRGLFPFLQNRQQQHNAPAPVLHQPPGLTPMRQQMSSPPFWPLSMLQAHRSHQQPQPQPVIDLTANAPVSPPKPIPLPSIQPLVSTEERSKMSDQEYEDYMLTLALSLSTKEVEDQKDTILPDGPEKMDKVVRVDAEMSLKEVSLDNSTTLEGWLQFEETRTTVDVTASSSAANPIVIDPQPQEIKALNEIQAPAITHIEQTVTEAVIVANVQPEEATGNENSDMKTEQKSEVEFVALQTGIQAIAALGPTPIVCGDSQEQQDLDEEEMQGGFSSPMVLSAPSSPDVRGKGRKRKNEMGHKREKRRKKTLTKMIKLQQELKEKTERIKGLEEQVEDGERKFDEQNKRISRLEKALTLTKDGASLLATEEVENPEFGSTWCSVM